MTVTRIAPSTVAELKALIVEGHHTLSKQGVRVMEFSLRCPDDVAFGTLDSLASAVEVSPATVLRALNSIGLDRFAEFRAIFRIVVRARAMPRH